jgi:UPF0716 protein FxsA
MLLKLFLLFTILPSFELWILFQVKEQLGLFETIWLVVITGVIGASMAKTQGVMVSQDLQERSKQGMPPTQTLLEGVLVLVGGVLLVTPGIFTDAFGFSLIIPWTRRLWAPFVQSWFSARFKGHSATIPHGRGSMSMENMHNMPDMGPMSAMGTFNTQFNTSQSNHESDKVDVGNVDQDHPTSSKKGFQHPKF